MIIVARKVGDNGGEHVTTYGLISTEPVGDGVSISIGLYPPLSKLDLLYIRWLQFRDWITWPLRKHKVIETIEIEIKGESNG